MSPEDKVKVEKILKVIKNGKIRWLEGNALHRIPLGFVQRKEPVELAKIVKDLMIENERLESENKALKDQLDLLTQKDNQK